MACRKTARKLKGTTLSREKVESFILAAMDSMYDDLELRGREEELRQCQTQLRSSEAALQTAQRELIDAKKQIAALIAERDQIELNAASLFKTAIREIERKDAEILSLRKELAANSK